ncbi:MAG: M24 family metallopeptidase [Alphaproteobacteria bacterium]
MKMRSPITDAELQRRWKAVATAMEADGIDALVMQNTSDWVGGYVRWFSDIPAGNGYPRTLVFYRDQPMTIIEMGPFDTVRDLGGTDDIHRGVGRMVHTPSFTSIGYTNRYDAELLVKEFQTTKPAKIGWLTPDTLPYSLVDAVQKMPDAPQQVDATDLVDTIKAIKSPEEIELIIQTADLQDKVFAEVCDFLRPGVQDIDVANHAQAVAQRLGSDQGIFLGTSSPLGRSSRFASRPLQARTIEKGDHFSLLIEINGPGGVYLEIARTMVLGTPSDHLLQSFEHMKKAQDYTLSLMKPGASPAEIAAAHDAWMIDHGLPPETRLYAHGQGVDMVERPMIRKDETMPLAANMCFAVHPGFDDGEVFAVICDNYMIEEGGVGACLHKTEKKIFQL